MEKIRLTAVKALATPMTCYETVVDGFKFMIHWDTRRNWFEATMSYTPGWAHLQYMYADTLTELIETVKHYISEAKRIYTNGGGFPENYGTAEWFEEQRKRYYNCGRNQR